MQSWRVENDEPARKINNRAMQAIKTSNLPAILILPAVLMLNAATANAAPSPATIDSRIDSKADRSFGAGSRGRGALDATGKTPDFTFSLSVPLAFNSNPFQDSSGHTDWHSDPEFTLDWSHQYRWVKLAARLDTDLDRYSRFDTNDSDTAYGYLNVFFTDGVKDGDDREVALVVPYVGYRATMGFSPTYAQRLFTFNDFYGGLRTTRISFLDSFDIQGGRRDSTILSSIYIDIKASRDIALGTTGEWALSLKPRLRIRWFDEASGVHRRDINPMLVSYIAYTPKNTSLPGSPEIDIGFTYVANRSTKSAAEFDQWDVGPSLTLSWKF